MTAKYKRTKAAAALLVAVILGSLAVPSVAAQTDMNVKSVGEIYVDAAGKASGQNVATNVIEAEGVLTSYTSLALGAELFSSMRIDGFAQAEKIQGVGSSSIVLRGSNAVVSVYDNINSVVKVEATGDTRLHYELSSGVTAKLEGDSTAHLYSETGAYLGSLILIRSEAGHADQHHIETTGEGNAEVATDVSSGSKVVFRGRPVYVEADAYSKTVAEAAAEGWLKAEVVTEFTGSAQQQSSVDYTTDVHTSTWASAEGGVETDVRSRAKTSAVVAYDLAYETLSVDSASEVAVYADGELATRVDTAAEVQAAAEAGATAYYAFQSSGRTQVLVSTPDFKTEARHKVAITASAEASAQTEAQARAEARARADARVEGDFQLHANGKLTGAFTTSIISEADASVHAYTALDARTEVFTEASVEGNANAQVYAEGDARVVVDGSKARVTLVDDVHATMVMDAKAQAEASFDLSADVQAHVESETVVRLEGSSGFAGTMAIAKADGSVAADSRFEATADGSVKAHLEPQARLVFRASADAHAHASESVMANAIAEGKLGAQVTAGFEAEAATAAAVEYYQTVQVDASAEARGEYSIDYQTQASAATTFVLDGRGTALSAKAESDILVYVDGQAAVQVASAQAAVDAEGYAAYYVDTTMDARTRVVVNTNVEANAQANVKVVSRLDLQARAAANADAFGEFKIFYDGTAIGSYVSLKTDVEAGVVSDFTMASTETKVFTSVKAGASSFVSAGADSATHLVLENEETTVVVSDTTSANMKIVAKAETTVDFKASADVQAEARARNVVEVRSQSGAHVGSMVITDVEGHAAANSYFEVNGPQIRAHLEAGAQVLFRTHVGVETELSATQRTMINHAIASGNVGGQVMVQTQAALAARAHAAAQAAAQARAHLSAEAKAHAETVVAAQAEAQGSVTTSVTASYYNDVQLVTAATKNRVDITASSTTSAGKTIIVSMDPATINGMAEGNAEILVDGKAAAQAESYADILDPNDDNGASEYFVLAGDAGVQVLVSIPHFSTRTVTLKTAEPATPPIFMYATIFLGVLVVAETAYLVRRREL